MLDSVLLALIYGILQGGAYGAIALGLSVIFGVTRVTNFAHGAMLMLSTFLYYELYTRFGIDPYLGLLIVTPILYFLGMASQKYLITPLLKKERGTTQDPASLLLITLGLGYAINNLFMMIYGSNYKTIPTAASKAYLTIEAGDFLFHNAVGQNHRVSLAAFAIGITLWFIINKTELGKRIRAVSQNRDAAAICGVDVYKTYAIAFGLGIAAVAVAGACLSEYYFVQPQVGTLFGVKSFLIVVLGGLGSIPGAILGGLIFGIVESVGAQFITSSASSMLTFILFMIMLFVKPSGLLGKGGKT